MTRPGFFHLLLTIVCLVLAMPRAAQAANPISIPLTPDHWSAAQPYPGDPQPQIQFARHEGFPQGVLVLKSGSAALHGLTFRSGTIEFDMKGMGQDIPGIQFRSQGPTTARNAEEFYVRTFPDCRASDDCIQYAPVIHGFMLWNSYPQYQTQAFILEGWNHIKLVVSGRSMNVYINRQPAPALAVGSLESNASEGGIEFRGPAYFANLTVTPDAVEALSPQPTPDPTGSDPGIVRQWQLGPLTPFHFGTMPAFSGAPSHPDTWQSLQAGRFGLVNLNRSFPFTNTPPPLTWLRTTVRSNRDRQAHVSFGWLGAVRVFVNGEPAAQGKNFYYPESERRRPDGRLSLENGSFNIPLHQGANEIVVALSGSPHDDNRTPNRYGWGLAMRFDDPGGLKFQK